MALTYDYSEVKDKDVMWDENDNMRPLTTTLIFSMIPTKMGEITEENWEKFYLRLQMWNMAEGFYERFPDGIRITAQDVKNHIGLRTNVTTESDATFKALLMRVLKERAKKALRKEEQDG